MFTLQRLLFFVSANRPQNRGVDAVSLCPLLSEGPRPAGCVVSALRAAPRVARRAIGTLGNAMLCPGWEGGLDGVLVASWPCCREGTAFSELGLLPRGCLVAGSRAHLSAAPLPSLFFSKSDFPRRRSSAFKVGSAKSGRKERARSLALRSSLSWCGPPPGEASLFLSGCCSPWSLFPQPLCLPLG